MLKLPMHPVLFEPIYQYTRGDGVFLPADVRVCSYRPRGTVTLLEVGLPE